MKEYVFKIIEDDGTFSLQAPFVRIDEQSDVSDLMAAFARNFLTDMCRHAVEDEKGFTKYVVQSLILTEKMKPAEH